MANTVLRDTLISGYLAVKGLSIINKQSKTITVIKKWQQLWVVIGQANTAQWMLAIYQDRNSWTHSQKPLTIYQFVQLHSFTDKQTSDGLHMFLLKFAGGHKISFACGTQKQKSEWLTAVQKALNACYNKKQQKEGHSRSVTDDDWWQLSEYQDNTAEFKEFQVVLSSCSLTGNINRCRVCLFPNHNCIEVYGYSTYSSYTVRWTWQYSQLYCISFDKEILTLTVQLYISDQLEEICWTGNQALQLYNALCNVSGVQDYTAQKSEAIVSDISPTLVRLEESDYTSVGVFLPDYLVQQMEEWYLVELVYYQHQPQLLGQYEVQLSLTHLHLKGCNSPYCWSWELHHIKSYSLNADQYLMVEVEGTSDVWSGIFHFGVSGAHDGHITTLYQLLQQLMVKLYLVVMIKQQLIVTHKQLSALMRSNQSLHTVIECFSCELLEGPSQNLLGHYTLQIFVDQIRVISNNAKWVWLLTELYSYKLDQEEVGGATYVTIQISNSASAMIEEWVWSGNHMIRLYSFLLELCQLLSQQSCQEILISQVVTIRLITSQIVTINTYTIQLTKDELVLIDADNQQVVCSYPLECIKRLNLDERENELIICTSESPALQPSELAIATDNAQELMLLINKAVQNKQRSFNAQLTKHRLSLGSHQSHELPSNNYKGIAHQVSDEQVSTKSQEAEYRIPTEIRVDSSRQSAQRHLISAHQIPANDQQVSVKTIQWYPLKTDHMLADTTDKLHKTDWDISDQPQVFPTKQEMIKKCEIKHQISANTAKQITPQLAEAQQQVSTKMHKIEHHSLSGFQQIQDNVHHQPLCETQLPTHEVVESKQQVMIKAQGMTEQSQAQMQHMLPKFQQVPTEIPQVPNESTNTVLLLETQEVSHLLVEDITPTKTGEIPQAKSQEASTEKATPLQPSLEAQLLHIPNQNPYEPLARSETKEVTHEIQQIVTGEEKQEYTLTKPRYHVMHQSLANTPVSVGAQQNMEPTSYLPQVKQSVTVDTLQTPNEPQLNIQISSQKIVDNVIKNAQELSNELQGSKCHVAVIAQQTPIVSDQATFQTPGEACDDQTMDQTQHLPMETIETVHRYQETSIDKSTVVDTKQEPTQVSNESTNTVLLLETQKVSHLFVEDITPREMPQVEFQHSLTGLQQTQTSGETQQASDGEIMDQTQNIPLETIETVHRYQETLTDKRKVVDTTEEQIEISRVPNESTNTVVLQTQKVSHLPKKDITPTEMITPTEVQYSPTGPRQTLQQTDTRSGDICNTEGMQQPLNKDLDKFQVKHCIQNKNANQPIKTHRKLPAVDQTLTKIQEVTQSLLLGTEHCEQTMVDFQPQPQDEQLVEPPRVSLKVIEIVHPMSETQEIAPHETVQESAQEAQVVTHQVSDAIWKQVSCDTEDKNQHMNEATKNTQAFTMADATSTESTTQGLRNNEDKTIYQMTKQTFTDTQQISAGPDKTSQQLPAEILKVMSDQPQILYQDSVETQLMSDEVHDIEHRKLSVEEGEEALQTHPQVHSMSGKTQEIIQSRPRITTTQTSVGIQKAEHQEQVTNEPQKNLGQLTVEMEQQMIPETVDYYVPAEPQSALNKHTQIMCENTIMKAQNTSPKMQETFYEAKEDPQCYMIANTQHLLNDSPQHMTHHPLADTNQISTEIHNIACSSSPQQPLLAPNDKDSQQAMTDLDNQFIDDNHKIVMLETHHCITSIDAPVMSYEASITHQSSILQATQQISGDQKKILHQTPLDYEYISHQWSSETQQISDSTVQPVMHGSLTKIEQTLDDTDRTAQIDDPQCTEVGMLYTSDEFERLSNRQFPKTAQELDDPQSVIMHEVLVNTMPTSVQHVVHHPPSEACHISIKSKQISREMSNKPQMKSSNTQELSDEAAEQIAHQLVENDNAQTTTNIQESLAKTHDAVKDDQLFLAIQSTPEKICTTVCQLPPTSALEAQKISLQHPLQQLLLEKSQQLQTEVLLDEANEDIDQPITLETKQEIPPSSQQVLFESTKAAYHNLLETQQIFSAIEPSRLLIDMQDQTQKTEPEQITYQLPKGVKDHQKPFETECAPVKTPENVSQIPVSTVPQMPQETVSSWSADTHQEASSDCHQVMSIETKEVSSLRVNDDIKEVTEVPPKVKQCFKFNSNKISHKISPFSVEVHELSMQDNKISCQPMGKTQQPASNKVQFETQQMAVKKTCPLSLEAQQSVIHEISIDYRQKTVETRKTFYKTPTPDDPHTFEHLFSIEAKQPLSSEQLQPEQISFKTQEITHRVPDKSQPIMAESGQFEKEQMLVEPPPNPLHVSNNTEILVETQEVVSTVEIPAEKEHIDQPLKAKKYIDPLLVEYDEDVKIIDFSTSDHVTKDYFIIVPSDHVCHHYHLYAVENVTPIGEEISTCTIHCCSYHILVKIEKISVKKKFNAVSIITPQRQYDLQSTRNAIDELLLKYL